MEFYDFLFDVYNNVLQQTERQGPVGGSTQSECGEEGIVKPPHPPVKK